MAAIVNMAVQSFLIILLSFLTASVLYHLALAASFLLIRRKTLPQAPPRTRFAIVVPAHNEELLIDKFCKNILQADYPSSMREIFIIADNCSDRTAEICSSYPVTILRRFNKTDTGKGYALKWAFEQIDMSAFDAVLILDADTTVEPLILQNLNTMIANGSEAIQCYIKVPNRHESWFTQLIYVSRTINNMLYHFAKYKLGLSAYLMGTGMCFKTSLLQEQSWTAFTLSEDWEYFAKLIGLGKKIDFAVGAVVLQQESRSLKQATTQRLRWSKGRFYVIKNLGLKLLFRGLRNRNWTMVDASLALLFPNWSLQINLILVAFCVSLILPSSGFKSASIILTLAMLGGQGIILLIGVALAGEVWPVFKAILIAPLFLVWKFMIDFVSMTGIYRGEKWIRTERHIPNDEPESIERAKSIRQK
jgi:cellulose synthase/poly-beta-1,6-N-acetylglucosamine synthase-like glycosyltransferase